MEGVWSGIMIMMEGGLDGDHEGRGLGWGS